jgi:sec-independent protein translocase protein TatA
MGIENPVHLLFIAAVALIVLGPKRLPEVAKALGHGIREFREAISQPAGMQEPPPAAYQQSPVTYQQPPVAPEPPVAGPADGAQPVGPS